MTSVEYSSGDGHISDENKEMEETTQNQDEVSVDNVDESSGSPVVHRRSSTNRNPSTWMVAGEYEMEKPPD